MPNLYARESYFNLTSGYCDGGGSWYETFTSDRGELFRALKKEYGRCVSKVYCDVPGGRGRGFDGVDSGGNGMLAGGWVFQQRAPYEDDPKETYLRETWVEVSEQPRPR